MSNTDTFLINYNPIERSVGFTVHKASGVIVEIADSEPLKDYENTGGLFSLEGQHEQLFSYIKENFDGKPEVSLKIRVPQLGFNKMKTEFVRFEENVKRFNKTGDIKVNLSIDVIRPEPKQAENSSAAEPCASEAAAPPVVTKPTIKAAVIGKISSGKTTLIEGLTEHNNSAYEISSLPNGTTVYTDSKNNIVWYEVAGIEFGKESLANAGDTLDKLIKTNGVSIALYCLHGKTGKMEDIERDFIVDAGRRHPGLRVYGVITASIDETAAHSFADTVSNATKHTKVFAVLAKELRTKAGFLPPFGLDELTNTIYGDPL